MTAFPLRDVHSNNQRFSRASGSPKCQKWASVLRKSLAKHCLLNTIITSRWTRESGLLARRGQNLGDKVILIMIGFVWNFCLFMFVVIMIVYFAWWFFAFISISQTCQRVFHVVIHTYQMLKTADVKFFIKILGRFFFPFRSGDHSIKLWLHHYQSYYKTFVKTVTWTIIRQLIFYTMYIFNWAAPQPSPPLPRSYNPRWFHNRTEFEKVLPAAWRVFICWLFSVYAHSTPVHNALA